MEDVRIDEVMENGVNELMEVVTEVSDTENAGGLVTKIAVAIGVPVVAGGVALLYKNRKKIADKRDKKQAEKLRKKGYIIQEPVVEELVEDDSIEESK